MPEAADPTDPAADPAFPVRARCVFRASFADAGVVRAAGRWWAHAATGPAGGVPALSSVDLVHWERAGDALPAAGAWAVPGAVSTPTLTEVGPGRFALWYSAVCAEHGTPALGVAVADRPGGPFHDPADHPVVCRPGDGGARSPAVLSVPEDPDGARRLYWLDGAGAVRSRRLDPAGTAPDADPDRPDETLVPATGRPRGVLRSITTAVTPTDPVLVAVTDTGVVTLPLGADTRPADDPDHPDHPADPDDHADHDDHDDPGPTLLLAVTGAGRATVVTHPDGSRWLLVDAPAPAAGRVPLLWLAALDGTGRDLTVRDLTVRDGGGRDGGAPPPTPVPLPAPPGSWRLPLPADPTPEQERVISAFTVHGALRALPARHARRVVLLDLLAQLFEPGLRYPEAEVDRRLTAVWAGGVHPDYARLRRNLVDENFLDRTGGVYRRSGGTVDPGSTRPG